MRQSREYASGRKEEKQKNRNDRRSRAVQKLKISYHKEPSVLVAGGRNAVMEALRSGQVKKLFVKEGKKDARLLSLLEKARSMGLPWEEKETDELDRMTGGIVHQGIAAELKPYEYADLERVLAEEKRKDPFLILLDGVEDVRNLGAIVRTAECAGATAVLLPKHKSPPVTPAALKTAAGAFMYLPVCQTGNISQTLEKLKKKGFWVVGADMDGQELFDEANLKGPLIIVMGAEGKGISPLTKKMCDFIVRIPLMGHVSSLNVSVAAALIMYAAARQRRKE